MDNERTMRGQLEDIQRTFSDHLDDSHRTDIWQTDGRLKKVKGQLEDNYRTFQDIQRSFR